MSGPRFREEPLSEYFVKLVDIIFGLTITQSFLFHKDLIISPQFSIGTLSLILVYATIILSWIGYHRSIQKYPYNKSTWSRIRLSADLFILLVYTYLVFVGQDFPKVLLGIAAVFFIYTANGLIRMAEWRDKRVSQPWLSIVFALSFIELWSWYVIVQWEYLPIALATISFTLLFSYRLIRDRLGYPRLFIVGVDVDGVLGEQVPHILKRIQQQGKATNLTKKDVNDWNYKFEDTDISKEIESALLDPKFIDEMPVIEGSKDRMINLYKKYHLVIATSRPKETEEYTQNWVKKHFKFHEFINTREIGKDKLGLDFLIDDSPENITKFASSGGRALLLTQPWNEIESNAIKQHIKDGKITRCEDWNDICACLEKLTQK